MWRVGTPLSHPLLSNGLIRLCTCIILTRGYVRGPLLRGGYALRPSLIGLIPVRTDYRVVKSARKTGPSFTALTGIRIKWFGPPPWFWSCLR